MTVVEEVERFTFWLSFTEHSAREVVGAPERYMPGVLSLWDLAVSELGEFTW